MANTSIKSAFERLWQHVTIALSNKAEKSHGHEIATASNAGFMSASDKSKLDAINHSNNLPTASSSQNGMFLRVVNGNPAWSEVPNAEEASF